eukprot:ctg_586.g302
MGQLAATVATRLLSDATPILYGAAGGGVLGGQVAVRGSVGRAAGAAGVGERGVRETALLWLSLESYEDGAGGASGE